MVAIRRNPAFSESSEELELYFGANDGILGLHGVGFGGGSTSVWDEERCNLAHAQRLVHANASEPERLRLITPTIQHLRALEPAHWYTALLTYTPRRWPEKLHTELARGGRAGNLVGLAITGEALRVAWHKLEPGRREAKAKKAFEAGKWAEVLDLWVASHEPTPLDLLSFATREAESSDASRKNSFFCGIIAEGERRLDWALSVYDRMRRARRQAAKAAARAEAMS